MMDIVQELQNFREELILEINEKIDWIIEGVKNENISSISSFQEKNLNPRNYEIIYPLTVGTGIFKGKRPIGTIFANGERIETPHGRVL